MADADDFDIEGLRRLLRGEALQQPAKAPEAGCRPPAPRKAAAKAGGAAPPAAAKAKAGKAAKPAAKAKTAKRPKKR